MNTYYNTHCWRDCIHRNKNQMCNIRTIDAVSEDEVEYEMMRGLDVCSDYHKKDNLGPGYTNLRYHTIAEMRQDIISVTAFHYTASEHQDGQFILYDKDGVQTDTLLADFLQQDAIYPGVYRERDGRSIWIPDGMTLEPFEQEIKQIAERLRASSLDKLQTEMSRLQALEFSVAIETKEETREG